MRRTLLAVGIAVLVSMLFAPHVQEWSWGHYWAWAQAQGNYFPVFCVDRSWYNGKPNPILWGNLVGQSAFAAILAAVLVNLRKRTVRQ